MLGLVDYSDSEGEEEDSQQIESKSQLSKEPEFQLPDAGALLGDLNPDSVLGSVTTPGKRGSVQITGSSRPVPRPTKTARGPVAGAGRTAAASPGSSGKTATLLPPQLRGRKNIPTEDYARLFTSKSLANSAGPRGQDAEPKHQSDD